MSSPLPESASAHPHDSNCSCTDPNARLTNATLAAISNVRKDLDPQQLSPEDMDQKIDFCVQYLRAEDIPPREKGCCTHVIGYSHALFALSILSDISFTLRPSADSAFATRLVDAWPGIIEWIDYVFKNWIVSPMFYLDRGRHSAIVTVVSSLRSFVKYPSICEQILAEQNGRRVYIFLGSCWLFESEEEFKNEDKLLSAVEPLLDLVTFTPGPPPELFFGCILSSGSQDVKQPARVAIGHLAWYLDVPTPWTASALYLLDYHLRMLSNMIIAPQYRNALLVQHAIRTVTRILVALVAAPYDPVTATGVAQTIASAVSFLDATLSVADGFAWITHTVQIGLLHALLRSQDWMGDLPEDRAATPAVVGLFKLVTLYTIYPSLLRPLSTSLRRAKESNLPTKIVGNDAVLAAYNELDELVVERSSKLKDPAIRCHNSSCRKVDNDSSFSSCSGCFTVSYCSPACQKAHWKDAHQVDCKKLKALREEGRTSPLGAEDYEFASKTIAIEEVRRRKNEIAPVWRADPPARTPVLSIRFDRDQPRGTITVGALEKNPPPLYTESAEARARWDYVVSEEIHKEHIILGLYLPFGCYGQLNFMWLAVNSQSELVQSEESVVGKLIRTVEIM